MADDLFGWASPHAYYEMHYDAGKRFPNLTRMGNVSCALLRNGSPEENLIAPRVAAFAN